MKYPLVLVTLISLFLNSTAFSMNKSELVDAIASNSGLSKADSKRALEGFISSTEGALKKGDRVSLVGFGSFSVSNRAARTGRNPQTGKIALCKRDGTPIIDWTFEKGWPCRYEGPLKKGDRVSLVGFGSFSVSNRAARTGRNPQTGKEIKIAAKSVVKFKAGADLSNAVKSADGGGGGGGKVYGFSPDGTTATRAFGKFFTNHLLGLNTINSQVVGWSVDQNLRGRDETHTLFPDSASRGHRITVNSGHFYLSPDVWGRYINSDFQRLFISGGAEGLEVIANSMLDDMLHDTARFSEKQMGLVGHELAHVVQQRSRIVVAGGIVGVAQAAADMQSAYVNSDDDDDSAAMIDNIARITGIEKSDIKRSLVAMYNAISLALQRGEVVSLGGLGDLSVPVNVHSQPNQMLRSMQKAQYDAAMATINNIRIVVGGGNDGDLRLKVVTKM